MSTEDAVFVTGGSSGIGFHAALLAAQRGHPVVLLARHAERLGQAADEIRGRVAGARVWFHPVDVADAPTVAQVMAEAMEEAGPPRRLILSAGITLPGLWDRVAMEDQRRVMDVNYFGSLNVVRAALPRMRAGAAIGLVGSAAGLVGTYGYGAYAPSKFALRGLAEVLRVELEPRKICVTLCMPPDTDTPMLEAERAVRPIVTSRIAESAALARPEDVAAQLLDGMDGGRFLVLPSRAVWLLALFAPWIAPLLRRRQAKLIRQFGSEV